MSIQTSITSPIKMENKSKIICRLCRMLEALNKEERKEIRDHLDKIDAIEQDPMASNQLLQFGELARLSVEYILSDHSPSLEMDVTSDATAVATSNPFVEFSTE
jgi:hypothetical protein